MDAVTLVGAASAAGGAVVAIAKASLAARGQWQRLREESRRDHLRGLPPGSRVIDLGPHGIVIEVGDKAARTKADHDAAR